MLLQIIEPVILENGHSQCPLCSKIMKEKWKITLHIQIHLHTGEKPYACTECNYASRKRENLKKHFNRQHC